MTEYARLVIAVDSTQAGKAGASLDRLGRTAKSADERVSGLKDTFRALAAPVASFLSVREVIRAADQYANLTNRLRLVTTTTEQLAYAQQAVMRSAMETYQPLETTAEVYQRIAQNANALGLNFAEVEAITKTVSRTIALSGADTQAAAGAMRQFGQALASGSLRGDELNSILEGTPALAQAIARGLGVSTGELRKMGAEGQLTASRIIKGLQDQEGAVEQMSRSMEVTAGQAMVTFRNSLVETVGKLDDTTSASRNFASAVLDLSSALNRFSSGEFMDYFRDSKQTAEGFNNEISVTLSQIRDLNDARARLDKSDPNDTVLFRFKFWNKEELDAEIAGLNGQVQRFQEARDRLIELANKPGQEAPKGEGSGGLTPPPSTVDSATRAIERQIAALETQAGSLGMAAGEAELYKLKMQGATATQLKQAEAALSSISAFDRQTESQAAYQRLIADLQTDEERLTEQMRERLAVLEAMQGLTEEERARVADRISKSAISSAPEFGGLAPEIGGAAGEVAKVMEAQQKLAAWRDQELANQREFLDQKIINEEQYADRVTEITAATNERMTELASANRVATLSMFEGLTSNAAEMFQQLGMEGSAAYKALFIAGKAAAIAQAVVSTEVAAAKALELGPIMGIPAASLVRGMGYASVGLIASTAISGMAHDGIDNIPKEGTWLLDKGERVVDRRTNSDLKDYLADRKGGGTAPQVTIQAPVTVEAQPGASPEEAQRYGREVAGAMTATALKVIEKESRPGGMLWNMYGGGR